MLYVSRAKIITWQVLIHFIGYKFCVIVQFLRILFNPLVEQSIKM